MTDVIEIPPATATAAEARRPVLLIAIGRQRVGKTTVLNTMVQYLRERGARFEIWNGDRHNATYNLTLFHPDVIEPPSSDFEEVRAWLEERIQSTAERGCDALLDIGGGETPLSRMVEELPIVQLLEARGVRVVVMHVVGPEKADLDYLAHLSGQGLLTPEAMLVVMNRGLVMSGRNATSAFAPVWAHPVLEEATEHGAEVAMFPLLPCMTAVVDRGLTFAEAARGGAKPGQTPLSFFDQARVQQWWTRDLPAFFAEIPPLWLPALGAEAEAADPQRVPAPPARDGGKGAARAARSARGTPAPVGREG